MDNKQLEILVNYGIYCLNRQEKVLSTYRKIQREYVDYAFIILGIIASIATIIASIWCAAAEYLEGWVPVVLTIGIGAFIVILIVTANVTIHNIASYKQFLVESRDITNTMTDITDVINLLDNSQGTEEDKQ